METALYGFMFNSRVWSWNLLKRRSTTVSTMCLGIISAALRTH